MIKNILLLICLLSSLYCENNISECEGDGSFKSLEKCATKARNYYHEGQKDLALSLANDGCKKGGTTSCYNSACYLAEIGKIPEALDSLSSYFAIGAAYPAFNRAVDDSQLKVLFSNEKIAEVLDKGNKYFFCMIASFVELDYPNFNFKQNYFWNGNKTKFYPELDLPTLAVNAYLSAFNKGDVNEALRYSSDLAGSEKKSFRAIGLKLAAYIYSCYIDVQSQEISSSLASQALKEGSNAEFLKEIVSKGIFPESYCKWKN